MASRDKTHDIVAQLYDKHATTIEHIGGVSVDGEGRLVNQGIAVYGNKGATDQHAYVQQLRDGVRNFFVTFVEVEKDRIDGLPTFSVEADVTPGRGKPLKIRVQLVRGWAGRELQERCKRVRNERPRLRARRLRGRSPLRHPAK